MTLSGSKVKKVKSSWQEYLFAKEFPLTYLKNKKMLNDTVWFTEISNGNFRINSRAIYRNLSSEIVTKLAQNLSVSEILDWIKNETIKAFREKYSQNPQVGALNKAIGGWNELIATSLLSEIIFDLNKETGMCIAAFSMPNSKLQLEGIDEAYSNFLNLFTKDSFAKDFSSGRWYIPIYKEGRFSAVSSSGY